MQNNRRIGPIHAMARQSANSWTGRTHGVGSILSGVIFGHIFIELFILF